MKSDNSISSIAQVEWLYYWSSFTKGDMTKQQFLVWGNSEAWKSSTYNRISLNDCILVIPFIIFALWTYHWRWKFCSTIWWQKMFIQENRNSRRIADRHVQAVKTENAKINDLIEAFDIIKLWIAHICIWCRGYWWRLIPYLAEVDPIYVH